MGKKIVRFRCIHCGHCCRDVVCLPTPWDVNRIVRETGADPLEFLEFLTPDEITGVSRSDPAWLECGGERYIMALKRDGHGCYFLKRGAPGCRIYDARPFLCRLYPYAVHETREGDFQSFSLHKDVGCPRRRDGSVDTAPLYEMYLEDSEHQHAYADLVTVFNRRQDPGKRPADFVTLFYQNKRRS